MDKSIENLICMALPPDLDRTNPTEYVAAVLDALRGLVPDWRDDIAARLGMRFVEGVDPSEIACPREKSDMTPCVCRDGDSAVADDGACVGCGEKPAALLTGVVSRYVALLAKHAGSS